MKPLQVESEDKHSLETLGRASIQIVHDLKNQLNGLKLYATFLRKRMEKTGRAEDELETVRKLIAGLDRAADDLSLISDYGQPVHLQLQANVDLHTLMTEVAAKVNTGSDKTSKREGGLAGPLAITSDAAHLPGNFDAAALAKAFNSISVGALKIMNSKAREDVLNIRLEARSNESGQECVIEWGLMDPPSHDIFRSFAGSDSIRMSLAARTVEAHGGIAECEGSTLRVCLPLAK